MKLRRRKPLWLVLIILVVGILGQRYGWFAQASSTIVQNTPGSYAVVEFADGDTVVVKMNGKNERVRLIGVDTPETQDPRKPVQCFGQAASEFTKNLIGNQTVRLEADILSSNRDRYNRLLRYAYLPDGRLVNAEIIKEGFGFAYTSFPFTKSEEFRAYETNAREANRGLWSQCQPETDSRGFIHSNPER